MLHCQRDPKHPQNVKLRIRALFLSTVETFVTLLFHRRRSVVGLAAIVTPGTSAYAVPAPHTGPFQVPEGYCFRRQNTTGFPQKTAVIPQCRYSETVEQQTLLLTRFPRGKFAVLALTSIPRHVVTCATPPHQQRQ